MAEKARDAFRTISEVANWLDIPAHVLRFWESKFPQIKPVKRAGGRRYYRPADMRLIGGIKTLLHDDGLTIRGVQKMLKEDGVKAVSELSPALDMPTEEEGAARRQARRARRQARQEARQPDQQSTKQAEDIPEGEAPFVHIEENETGGDNVVPMTPERDDLSGMSASDEATAQTEPEVDTSTEAQSAPAEQDVEPEPVTASLFDQDAPVDEQAIAETPLPDLPDAAPTQDAEAEETSERTFKRQPHPTVESDEDVETVHRADEPLAADTSQDEPQPVSTIPEPQPTVHSETEADTPAAEPVEAAIVPDDPDPADVTLTDQQRTFADNVKRLRRSTALHSGQDATRQAALAKLTELRAKMASSLG